MTAQPANKPNSVGRVDIRISYKETGSEPLRVAAGEQSSPKALDRNSKEALPAASARVTRSSLSSAS